MSKQDTKEVNASLVRIETKLEMLNGTITKVVYALIGIIAATVGIQFTPHSPIDWIGGADTSTRFLAILVSIFMSAMIWKAYKAEALTKTNPKWLCRGLIFMSMAMLTFSVCPTNISFYVILPIRLAYVLAFGYYGWHVTDVNHSVK